MRRRQTERGQWGRWPVWLGGGILFAVLLAGVIGAVVFNTRWGSNEIRAHLLPRINDSIAGDLGFDRLWWRGDRLVLTDLVLRDPEGRLVAALRRLEVDFAPLVLLRRRFTLESVVLDGLRLHLVADERGLNLARAVAGADPRPEAPPPGSDSPSAWTVRLERLLLRDGAVDFRQGQPGPDLVVRFDRLRAEGSGRMGSQAGQGELRLELDGRSRAPLAAPLMLSVFVEGDGSAAEGTVHVSLGDNRLGARARATLKEQEQEQEQGQGQRQERTWLFDLRALRLEPQAVSAFVPAYPVKVPLEAQGTVRRAGDGLVADLVLEAGGGAGRIELAADVDVDARHVRRLRVGAEHLDFSRLLAEGPASDLGFSLVASGDLGARSLDHLSGRLELHVPPGPLGGETLGPAHLRASARDGILEQLLLTAEAPGVSLEARAHGNAKRVDARADLRIRNLTSVARAFGQRGIGGRGRLTVFAQGPWQGPAISAQGQFRNLRARAQRIGTLRLALAVPDLGTPLLASGRVQIDRARLGGRIVRGLRAALATRPDRRFVLTAQAAAPQAVRISAAGRWTATREGLRLSRLRLAYPEAVWRLAGPARIRITPWLSVQDLRLVSGDMVLAVGFSGRGRSQVALDVERLLLSKLPRLAREALEPPQAPRRDWEPLDRPRRRPAGKVDLHLEAKGPWSRPQGAVEFFLQDGRLFGVRGVTAELRANSSGRRATGQARVTTAFGQLEADLDLPVRWPPPPRAALALDVRVLGLDLGRALGLLDGPRPAVRGTAGLSLGVRGTFSQPSVDLALSGRGLTLGGHAVGKVDLLVTAAPGRPARAELEVERAGQVARASLAAPLDLGRALRRPPTADELSRLPFDARFDVQRFPVAAVAALVPSLAVLRPRGAVSIDVDARGPLTAPSGHARIEAHGLGTRRLAPTEIVLAVKAPRSERELVVSAHVARKQRQLFTLAGRLGVSAAALAGLGAGRATEALRQVPIEVEAKLGPLRLQRVPVAAATDGDRPRVLRGSLQASLAVQGRLAKPRLRLEATARDIALQGTPLGDGRLELRYADAEPRLELHLRGVDGGSVQLSARSTADLGYPQISHLRPQRLPLEATLAANGYDLALLSCLSDAVPIVEGRLYAQGQVSGEVGTPEVQGRIEWKDGRVRVAGFGEYRNIHLLLHGDRRRIVLEELAMKAGAGDARLVGKGSRQPEGGYAVNADARLRRFPLYSQGQPLGALALDAEVSGRVAPAAVDLVAKVDEADIRLAAGGRRDVQPLERPADVVLTWNDQPLNRRQADKGEAIERRLAALRGQVVEDGEVRSRTAGGAPGRVVRLQVDAPNNLWVRGPDANLELGLGPDFSVTVEDELRVFGAVFVRRGQVEVLGRRFRLSDSSVLRFTGPPDRPVLDVRAVHQPRHAADTTVVVTLEGPADALDISLEAPGHPEYSQSDLVMLVATGRVPELGSGSTAPSLGGNAVSLLGGFLASKVKSTLMRRLPIDVLNIDPGDQLTGLQLEAGTYLGDDLYVAYVARIGQDPFLRENRNEIQLEYQLSRHWSFEASYGDARRGSGDLVWTRSY